MSVCESLSGGITLGCGNNLGGILKLYLVEKEMVSSVTLGSPTTTISAFTMTGSPSATFYEFEFNKNTSSYTEEGTSDQATGRDLYIQTITLVLNRREKTKRDTLLLLAKRQDLVAIIKDHNGLYWYFGESYGLNLTTNSGGSGTTKTDPNQYVLTFVGEEPDPANEVDEAAVTAVI